MSYELQLVMIMYTAKFGDLIEFSYPIGYSHWALYDGDGYVVHFAVADENWATYMFRSSLETMLPSSGTILFGKTKIRRVHIREVKVPQGVRMFINNYHHSYVASDPWYIRQRVNALLGRQFTYDLFNLNCEHFATYLRYGRAVCNQIPFRPKNEECVEATKVFRNIVMRYKK
ncbi:retinoic acid receptor responder protein 3-like isoform X2 [Gouania willdenowi]|uniref:retinoic acid receptor responder protein 3-like isoform X2 n=1 Tax=Gouania willdenowi TaxID=441366 RepID=UPI0010565CB7|nr:retinoic acid receptor responder protein 3-like isoform X2 [Gouania willdenowi]XP_028309747.1 retinoic acid receptor responder protein 3-like isoform X2 [Gouania willdenowi]